jgi:hypothetical protein
MIKMTKIFLTAILLLSTATLNTQGATINYNTRGMILNTESIEDTMKVNLREEDKKQAQKAGDKKGSVKQVKSARPDMSKSRGARPPDIVRPSGSRIPKGVGRPAGAVRHGRG